MKILLSDEEINLLAAESIYFVRSKDYTEQEAFELLEKIYDAEIMYSNYPPDDMRAKAAADKYAHLADQVQRSIPEQ